MTGFDALLAEVRACRACGEKLPLGPRPVLQLSPTARILIASQAPGTKVHASGIPFSDPSGERLRQWMGVSPAQFYDATAIAIVPMGLCYPGRAKSGDAPPRPECAPLWRERLLSSLPDLRLTLLVGSHAQNHALGPGALTDRVRNFAACLPAGRFPLPHPSWRSALWTRKHPWFEQDVLPALRLAIRRAWPEGGWSGQTRDDHQSAVR
ncbi:MAG: uracil-DNA glycosylase [Alphaproteobacteria bacterium]|jgi:uracil-DNA glycosylase|nr:uracil-DNA glycosylase [Alphaproteobacteria bacterium]